jgi:hypothetical protein
MDGEGFLMPVTREPDYPVEAAQLMQAFNMAADGFSADAVLNASLQMVAAAICYVAKDKACSLQQTMDYADHITSVLKAEVKDNFQRKPKTTDVPVVPS